MCSNTTTSMVKNEPTSRRRPAACRTRKKPKFLSLKKELSPLPEIDAPPPEKRQLELFPLHPESVDHLLDSGGGATLAGLLNAPPEGYAQPDGNEFCRADAVARSALLVRAAMKRGRVGEEKWVRYSEVVEKREAEEVSSCSEGVPWTRNVKPTRGSLSLKLDYQEILDAWSDKGSLYIGAADAGDRCPQTVPDLRDDDFFGSGHDCAYNSYGVMNSWGSAGNLWTVPENSGSITSSAKIEEEGGKEGCSKREASVLRYKEKRQNRLFSKQIRYQVRKLNAEKRPRMKGRFVKRN